MQRVSIRTLVLLVELLVAVVSFQYLAALRRPEPRAVWLADDGLQAPYCQSAAE